MIIETQRLLLREINLDDAWDMVRIDDCREIEAMTALSGDRPRYIGWVPVERVLKQKENG